MEMKPNINEVLSGFAPTRPIGQGGMASIVLYENRLTGEVVAVKSLHPQVATQKDTISRFFHEVQASLRLDHKNIVKILGFGDLNARPSMVIEYIDGGDLKNLIERVDIFPVEVVAYIGYQIFKGLDYSHRLGIVHRDIKPSNILLDRTGVVKITDFGISKVSDLTRLTHSGDVVGTPAYMSPEQASGERIDESTDLFSTGVVLYELLTHRNPFLGDNTSITLLNIIRCNPTPIFELNPAVSYKMEAALDLLLAREPRNRCQSADEAAGLMRDIMNETSTRSYDSRDFQEFLNNPDQKSKEFRVTGSNFYLEKGKGFLSVSDKQPEKAAVEFHRSLFLNPENSEAKQCLTSITEASESHFEREHESKIRELEEALQKDPNNVPLMLQLVKRCRMDGDFIKAIAYSKRLARLRPNDVYILGQIETLLPSDQYTSLTQTLSQKPMNDAQQTVADSSISAKRRNIHSGGGQPKKVIAQKSTIDPMLVIGAVIVMAIVFTALMLAKQFRQASQQVNIDVSNLFTSQDSSGSSTEKSANDQSRIPAGKALEVVTKAQESIKAGNRDQAIEFYRVFLDENPEHAESSNIRMLLASLYRTENMNDLALQTYDELISKGHSSSHKANAQFQKVLLLKELNRNEDARWECFYMESSYTNISSPLDQIKYLKIYANLCEYAGNDLDAIKYYDRIVNDYNDKESILEARLLKASVLIRQGNLLDAQRELEIVRDQTPPESFNHKTAMEKLENLGIEPS